MDVGVVVGGGSSSGSGGWLVGYGLKWIEAKYLRIKQSINNVSSIL